MSKNGKGKSPRRHSNGHGRRAWKATLPLGVLGCCADYFINGKSLHTPPIHVKDGKKMVTVHLMDERNARRGMAVGLRRLEDKGLSDGALVLGLNEPGLVSKNWKGSNRHDRPRDADVPTVAPVVDIDEVVAEVESDETTDD